MDIIKPEEIKNNRNFCPLINGPCKEIALITDHKNDELEIKQIEFGDERPACYFFNFDDDFCEVKKFLTKGSYLVDILSDIFLETMGDDYTMARKIVNYLKRKM